MKIRLQLRTYFVVVAAAAKTSMNASVTVVKFVHSLPTVTTLQAPSAVSAAKVSNQCRAVKPLAPVRHTCSIKSDTQQTTFFVGQGLILEGEEQIWEGTAAYVTMNIVN